MDVEIGEINSTVRAVDGNSILTPRLMAQIVKEVLQAVRDERDHHKRVRAERKVSNGVSHEQAEDERY
jgi:hypothetical protein